MQCHAIILVYTTDTTYTLYEIEKQKATIKEKTITKYLVDKSRENNNKMKAKARRNNLSCPPPAGEVANT